jgi:PAS domain S-box-containing protein
MARAERGESQVRAVISGPRDIRDMAQAFNSMMAALQERELALRESQARYREVVDGVREVIFQTDPDGAWSLLNPAWEEVTGVPVKAALGKPMADFVLGEDRATLGEWAARLCTGAVKDCRFDVRFRRADGGCRWIEVALHPRYDGSGRFAGASGMLEDVTENRLAAERLAELNRELENRVRVRTTELEASNRELEAFSYSVSHDLRAPLRAIDGFVRMVEKDSAGALNGTARYYLARVRSAAQRMSQLIDGLLELARISRTKLNRQPTDLSALAREIANELRDAEPQRCAELAIQPDLVATVDPVLVRVVIDNLIGNAWKYSGQRQLARVVFGAEIIAGQGSSVEETVYFVRDNGAGFDMAYAESLFRPFCRLHGDQEFAGTGIGLATVERIIRRHDGRIWAEGWVDGGAIFRFTLGASRDPARGA